VHSSLEGNITLITNIKKCEKHFEDIEVKMKTFDPTTFVKVFLDLWSILEFFGGMITGAAALGPTIADGLNPVNSKGWI
jgi:hypothetical protein